jgi:hypothetical protein
VIENNNEKESKSLAAPADERGNMGFEKIIEMGIVKEITQIVG